MENEISTPFCRRDLMFNFSQSLSKKLAVSHSIQNMLLISPIKIGILTTDAKGGIRLKSILTMLLIPFFLLNASAPPQVVPPDYLITEITITCPGEVPSKRRFTDQQSIRNILQFLRDTDLYSKADTASMEENAPLYTVTLIHVTGRQTVYRQMGTEYLSKGGSPWYHIDPERGKLLRSLYHNQPNSATFRRFIQNP